MIRLPEKVIKNQFGVGSEWFKIVTIIQAMRFKIKQVERSVTCRWLKRRSLFQHAPKSASADPQPLGGFCLIHIFFFKNRQNDIAGNFIQRTIQVES